MAPRPTRASHETLKHRLLLRSNSSFSAAEIQEMLRNCPESFHIWEFFQSKHEITEYVEECLDDYQETGKRDFALWQYLQEDFKTWGANFWENCDPKVRLALRTHLIKHGIYMAPLAWRNTQIAVQMAVWLTLPKYHVWTMDEISYWRAHGGLTNSQWNPEDAHFDPALLAPDDQSVILVSENY